MMVSQTGQNVGFLPFPSRNNPPVSLSGNTFVRRGNYTFSSEWRNQAGISLGPVMLEITRFTGRQKKRREFPVPLNPGLGLIIGVSGLFMLGFCSPPAITFLTVLAQPRLKPGGNPPFPATISQCLGSSKGVFLTVLTHLGVPGLGIINVAQTLRTISKCRIYQLYDGNVRNVRRYQTPRV